MEDFSKEYGRWTLSGDAESRVGATRRSTSTPSAWTTRRPPAAEGRHRQEARGPSPRPARRRGPGRAIAGSLGYSPDKPFSAVAWSTPRSSMWSSRAATSLSIKGRYGKTGARIGGHADFSRSTCWSRLQPGASARPPASACMIARWRIGIRSRPWPGPDLENISTQADQSQGPRRPRRPEAERRGLRSSPSGPASPWPKRRPTEVFKGDIKTWTLGR